MPLFEQAREKISQLTQLLLEFLFPRNKRVIHLESMRSRELIELLPQSEKLSEDTFALFDYSHTLVKEIIWEVKYKGNHTLAETLGEILYDVVCSELEERNIFDKTKTVVLLPSPISDKRRFERGWNQSELLAQALKKHDISHRFKYLPRQLAKIIHTESQTHTASKKERLENLNKSMRVLNPLSVQDQYVVVIDDVTTTGATFREAKRALRDAGAKKILCFAVAH